MTNLNTACGHDPSLRRVIGKVESNELGDGIPERDKWVIHCDECDDEWESDTSVGGAGLPPR